jgi:hypothetical protein
MKASRVSDNKKKIGRPRTGVGALVGQRWHEEQLAQIDRWRRAQADMPGRSEAIRRLVELGLKVKTEAKPIGKPGSKLEAPIARLARGSKRSAIS